MDLTFETLEKLVALATANHLAELEVKTEDHKVVIKTALSTPAVAVAPSLPQTAMAPVEAKPAAPPASSPEAAASGAANWFKVTSPMVGTFYQAPSPDAPPYVQVGDTVRKGQTLCIIEAMKLMNELECEVDGIIRRITVENGKPVEFGQTLFEIEVS